MVAVELDKEVLEEPEQQEEQEEQEEQEAVLYLLKQELFLIVEQSGQTVVRALLV